MLVVVSTFSTAPKERLDNAKQLAESLNGTIHIGGTNYTDNFIDILKNTDDDLLYLEDDIEVCTNFLDRVQDALKDKEPDKIVSFFRLFSAPNTDKEPIHLFSEMQCLYIPKVCFKPIIDRLDYFKDNFADYKHNNTEMLIACTSALKEFYIHLPCLVQQHKWNSTISPNWIDTQTKYYIEDMNDSSK